MLLTRSSVIGVTRTTGPSGSSAGSVMVMPGAIAQPASAMATMARLAVLNPLIVPLLAFYAFILFTQLATPASMSLSATS